MHWQEKIDILKKRFSPSEFQDPFTYASEILQKIEAKFVMKQNSMYRFGNWADDLKNQILIRTIPKGAVNKEIEKLDPGNKYWIVVVFGSYPTAKQLVYDGIPTALEAIAWIAPGDFYIIHKKYEWLTYFKADDDKEEVVLIKSGGFRTPFDDYA